MAGAHPTPQFSVDERVFMVLKYTEPANVLKAIIRFQHAVSESEDTMQRVNSS